ncbi:CLUMA_CG006147, isoform A [Clunio marinus]|uniref:CLUMA_CG006147, isoform A n=1 Tax=Clunio marinus TaxID=568069 RepID=A0A1J1HX47_9DIPT|nr:CLUMA_CG006147, isoform A [Clunio marinus]
MCLQNFLQRFWCEAKEPTDHSFEALDYHKRNCIRNVNTAIFSETSQYYMINFKNFSVKMARNV